MKLTLSIIFSLTYIFVLGQGLERGPYLQQVSSSGIIIKWRTSSPLNSKVWYGTSIGNLNQSKTNNLISNNHEVLLTGLQPSTVVIMIMEV